MAEAQANFQKVSDEFQDIQKELQNAIASRQKLEAQRQENLNVEKEFANLKDGEKIYKLVGPVLLEQDKIEAESTVKGRLEFIGSELSRVDKQISDIQVKLEKKKNEIIHIQASAQAAPGTKGKAATVQT